MITHVTNFHNPVRPPVARVSYCIRFRPALYAQLRSLIRMSRDSAPLVDRSHAGTQTRRHLSSPSVSRLFLFAGSLRSSHIFLALHALPHPTPLRRCHAAGQPSRVRLPPDPRPPHHPGTRPAMSWKGAECHVKSALLHWTRIPGGFPLSRCACSQLVLNHRSI